MPSCFSTAQTAQGKIYMVGGLVKDMVLKNTFVIDENLVYNELAMMKVGRFSAPLALLNDKYILAAGGHISTAKNKYTNSAELYDIAANKWYSMEPM